jgi:hypothetical protein
MLIPCKGQMRWLKRVHLPLPKSGSLLSACGFAECFFVGHSAKKSFPSGALGTVILSATTMFNESRTLGIDRHTTKTLPSVSRLCQVLQTLSKEVVYTCRGELVDEANG